MVGWVKRAQWNRMKFDGLNCMDIYIYHLIMYMPVYESVKLACECTDIFFFFFWGGVIGFDLNANIMFW